jgi:hypothetical protein
MTDYLDVVGMYAITLFTTGVAGRLVYRWYVQREQRSLLFRGSNPLR